MRKTQDAGQGGGYDRGAGIQLTRLERFEQFCDLKAEWDALATSQVDTIFLTHDWLMHWWLVYGGNARLWTVVARDKHGLAAIVPLTVLHGPGGLRRITFMGSGEVTPNHLDLIVRPDVRVDVLGRLADHLCDTVSQWDVLELDKLPGDSGSAEQLCQRLSARRLVPQLTISARCPYAELPETLDVYWKSLGSETRHGLQKKRKRLERDFPSVRFVVASTAQEVDRVLGALIRMHQARWTKKGYPGAFSNESFVRFHHHAALAALKTDHLRLCYLGVGQEVAAATYVYRVGACVQDYMTAFDERWSVYSPAMLLRAHSIEQFILEGARRFDFLEGEEAYKNHWATGTRDNLCLTVFAPRWQGRLAKIATQVRSNLLELGVRHVPLGIRRPLWQTLLRLRARKGALEDRR